VYGVKWRLIVMWIKLLGSSLSSRALDVHPTWGEMGIPAPASIAGEATILETNSIAVGHTKLRHTIKLVTHGRSTIHVKNVIQNGD
jgi:hypothetical protein